MIKHVKSGFAKFHVGDLSLNDVPQLEQLRLIANKSISHYTGNSKHIQNIQISH